MVGGGASGQTSDFLALAILRPSAPRSQVGREVGCDHRCFLTPRPQGTQLPAVMLWRCVMEQVLCGSGRSPRRPNRSPDVASWISPSGTMRGQSDLAIRSDRTTAADPAHHATGVDLLRT